MPGRSVRLFFVDGSAAGVVTAEVMNWTGHLLIAPRSKLGEALDRDESARTGIYILVGEDPDRPTRPMIYIGEGDSVASRLRAHAKDESKEFWTRACIITSKDANLTKAHVRYLEHELVKIAKRADRATVTNGNEPAAKQLPEADRADMQFFIDQIEVVLPAVGFDFLRTLRPPMPSLTPLADVPEATALSLVLNHRSGVEAKALEVDGEIVVLAGSQVQNNTGYVSVDNYGPLRQELVESGVIVNGPSPDVLVFCRDYAFSSPSAAAAVIIGRNANGRRNWKLSTGESLAEWQDKQLGTVL